MSIYVLFLLPISERVPVWFTWGELPYIIVLTTSDGGDIIPEMNDRQIDAISSASIPEETVNVADEIIDKINSLLGKRQLSQPKSV